MDTELIFFAGQMRLVDCSTSPKLFAETKEASGTDGTL